MLYNIFVCLVAGFSGIFVFIKINSIRKEREVFYSRGVDYFLLSFGVLWILVATRILFVWLGYPHLDKLMWHYVVGPLTYIHILPLFYFYGSLFFNKAHYRSIFGGLFSIVTLFAVISLFIFGFELAEITYWGTKYNANDLTHKIFTFGMFVPALICVIFELCRRFIIYRRGSKFSDKQLLGINVALLIYALVAVFDGLAIASGWNLLLVRIGIMVSALIIYFFITEEEF